MRRLALIALVGLAGCITPSIPIPPPDPGDMDFVVTTGSDGASTAVLTYPADHNYADGVVYVQNHNTGIGIFEPVNSDDSIGPTQPLPAVIGDEVVMTVEAVAQTVSTCVILRQGAQDPDAFCTF